MDTEITNRAVESVVRQWNGGEHVLAGARASQLVYGKGAKPDQKMMDRITAEARGIERYLSAPESPITKVSDQAGDPLSRQPENDMTQLSRSNLSSDQAKREQAEVDAAFAPGRERAEKADADGDIREAVGNTKLNPDGSDRLVVSDPKRSGKKPGGGDGTTKAG